MDSQVIQMSASIGMGAISTFCAIMLWPKTRDLAWMLVIVGTIVHYGVTIFQILELVGVVRLQMANDVLEAIFRAVMLNAPLFFSTIGFIIVLRRKSGMN